MYLQRCIFCAEDAGGGSWIVRAVEHSVEIRRRRDATCGLPGSKEFCREVGCGRLVAKSVQTSDELRGEAI